MTLKTTLIRANIILIITTTYNFYEIIINVLIIRHTIKLLAV